ncbi:ribonuclease activity regulator RraA [Occultella gossypii]|uniref:Putative 4-hydroxy-4-methyl-2-oxoglutarate aldolase n=1 Tax=Occultella gossypii TaxID=2800820 RepID=A0ABS7SDV3_9MICO|nr:ribonuclease activity regulator RraA [Occultella gossypii]MBZ2197935.1 ribonuclease activity regulator RraA [Occultella gossypii]
MVATENVPAQSVAPTATTTADTPIPRITQEQREALAAIGSATVSSQLSKLGIRDAHLTGIGQLTDGDAVAGTALTLKFMPKREDLYRVDEYADPEVQLHRHVLYAVEPGDIVVVDGRGNMSSGLFGEMMLTYLLGRGGVGLVVDGCIRDWPSVRNLGLPVWARGTTPNFHTQTDLMPFDYNSPIACGEATVIPGDAIVADADGAVVVPAALVDEVIARSSSHHDWEEFSRLRLLEGGDMRRYYPLSEAARPEYEEWARSNGH